MERVVTFEKKPLHITGRSLKLNTVAPDFTAITQDFEDISLKSFEGKIKLCTFFPSIDHPICDIQVREFNKKSGNRANDIAVIGISKDLPFAQKRFCDTFDIHNIDLISDYRFSSFGINYGVLIKELNLLARGAVIIDKKDVLRYMQVIKELTNQPDFDDIFNALNEVIKKPEGELIDLGRYKCEPCEGKVPPLSLNAIATMIPQVPGWELVDNKKITRQFQFKNFVDAKHFHDILSMIAEEQGHHPSLLLTYNRLKVTLTTHASGGLTENDFVMARIINQLE